MDIIVFKKKEMDIIDLRLNVFMYWLSHALNNSGGASKKIMGGPV
jgi:hypothetical protein